MTDKLRIALQELTDAFDFAERVRAASLDEQIAVGRDYINRMDAATRAVIAAANEL